MNFFLDEPLNYRALVLVPAPALRQATVARIASGAALSVHQPLYSALAYPYVPTYQNSNQFVLENLALARAGMLGGGRETAIAQLRQTRFQPYIVRLTGFERLGGSFKANLHFDDHPRAEADDNRYAVVTVDTIERWLVANDALAARVEVK
jgi:hypothetical protein